MEDNPTKSVEEAAKRHGPKLHIWRACSRDDGREIRAIFVDDRDEAMPSSPWIQEYLERNFEIEHRGAPTDIAKLMLPQHLLVTIAEDEYERLLNELRLLGSTIAALAYRLAECAAIWLEVVSHPDLRDFDNTEDIDAILRNLEGFLSGMVTLTRADPALDQLEAEWESDRAKYYLEPLLSQINPRWADLSSADFLADLDIVRRGNRNAVRGRPTSANRPIAAAAHSLIQAWERQFGTVAGRGTSKKAPFYVLRQIFVSTEVIYPVLAEGMTLRGFPEDELRILYEGLFGGDPPAFLRSLDANYKLKMKRVEGKVAP